MDYFQIKGYTSNSLLSQIEREMNGDKFYAPTSALEYGKLVDYLITEPEKVDMKWHSIKNDDGSDCFFDDAKWENAINMKKRFLAHPIGAMVYNHSIFQHEYYKTISFIAKITEEKDGVKIVSPSLITEKVKCKFDFLQKKKPRKFGADLKTTTASNPSEFEMLAKKYGYIRQGAFYMDIAGLEDFYIIGVSKNPKNWNYPIMFIHIKKGGELHKEGQLSYQNLIYLKQIYGYEA